jgi:hypothetical protein
MTDHPPTRYDAERGDPDAMPLIPLYGTAVDDAMEYHGREREYRYRESDMVAAVGRLYLASTGDGNRPPSVAVFREAMYALGYVQVPRYNARDLGRALGSVWQERQAQAREIDTLTAALFGADLADDEPEEVEPDPVDLPAGLYFKRFAPGNCYGAIHHTLSGRRVVYCRTREAACEAIEALRGPAWGVSAPQETADAQRALAAALRVEGVTRG